MSDPGPAPPLLESLLAGVWGADAAVERLRAALGDLAPDDVVVAIAAARMPQYGVWAADGVGDRLGPALDRALRGLGPWAREGFALVLARSRLGPVDAAFDRFLTGLATPWAGDVHEPLVELLERLPEGRRAAVLLPGPAWPLLWLCPTPGVAEAAVGAAAATTGRWPEVAEGLAALGGEVALPARLLAALPSATPAGRRALLGALARLGDAGQLRAFAGDADPVVREQIRAGRRREPWARDEAVERLVASLRRRPRYWEELDGALAALGRPDEALAAALAGGFVHHPRWPWFYGQALERVLPRLPAALAARVRVDALRQLPPERLASLRGYRVDPEALAAVIGPDDDPKWYEALSGADGEAVAGAWERGRASVDPLVVRLCEDGLRRAGRFRGPVWPFERDAPAGGLARLEHFARLLTARRGYGEFSWGWARGLDAEEALALSAGEELAAAGPVPWVAIDAARARERLRGAVASDVGLELAGPALAAADGVVDAAVALGASFRTCEAGLFGVTFDAGIVVDWDGGCGVLWYVNDQ